MVVGAERRRFRLGRPLMAPQHLPLGWPFARAGYGPPLLACRSSNSIQFAAVPKPVERGCRRNAQAQLFTDPPLALVIFLSLRSRLQEPFNPHLKPNFSR